MPLETATQAIDQAVAELHMPDSSASRPPAMPSRSRSRRNTQPLLILAALLAVYIVLGVLYESLAHPLTIISTLPSAGLGALIALRLARHGAVDHRLHRHHSADRHRQEERHHAGRLRAGGRASARPDAGARHLRGLPGALPAHPDDDAGGAARRRSAGIAAGPGSELRRPLGIAIIGGLIVSQVLTLYTTPVIYLLLDKLHRRLAGRRRPDAVAPAPNLAAARLRRATP